MIFSKSLNSIRFNTDSFFSARLFGSKLFGSNLFNASLLTLAALGLALPTASLAQQALGSSASANSASPSSALASTSASLADGTYLFGQSPSPDVIGSAYAVLSVQGNRTVGAFYMPHSSYDCFSGEVTPTHLAVNVVDSYSRAVYPFDVALTVTESLVAGEATGAYTLEGFHRIGSLSEKDREMLSVCEADFAQ